MHARLPRSSERGQALALFVISIFAIIGMVAIVIDVSWFWVNQQQMQRAADAGALAGAVYLPGDTTSAYSSARAEATKNGYTSGVGGVTVTPQQDPSNRRRLRVSITGPVDSYFARVFCIVSSSCLEQATISISGLAEFVLPVPMGSPQNYFGVGYLVDATSPVTTPASAVRSTGSSGTGSWTGANNVVNNDNNYASESTNGDSQQWGTFGLLTPIPSGATIDGIQVKLVDLFLTGSGTATNCRVQVELSWNGGTNWTTAQMTPALTTSNGADYDVGSTTDTTAWGSHAWTRSELSDTSFRVRLTWSDGTSSCASTQSVSLDDLDVQVNYRTTSTSTAVTDVLSPTGGVLAPQNFWGAMNSQGAPSIQGDAYMTKYEVRSSTLNGVSNTDPDAHYAPSDYYNYGVEVPAGGTGEVWLYDAGFCDAGSAAYGTGEFWTVGGSNGYSTRQPVSAFYDLYDSNDTPYEIGDDTLVASSNDTYADSDFQDHALVGLAGGTASQPDCGSESWHHGWWKIADGLPGGKTYRLHTYSTDFSSPTDQDNATAHNAFAIWAASSTGTPRVYGIGAMEAYVRLPGGVASEFYLAQIEDEHAGKTMVIDLWDPGDTGALSASLQILKPTSSDYVPVSFDYTAARGTGSTQASSCDTLQGSGVTSVTTNSGGSSVYNGCWLQITIQLPSDYDAPHPASDTVTSDGGWWKIRYTMGGSTSSFSTDLTTWQVSMRGSPVHLVPDGS